jgi:hypothetical protein
MRCACDWVVSGHLNPNQKLDVKVNIDILLSMKVPDLCLLAVSNPHTLTELETDCKATKRSLGVDIVPIQCYRS